MFLAQLEDFRDIRLIFEAVIHIDLITLMAQFMNLDPLPPGNPGYFFGMNCQEKHSFMQHLVVRQIMQQCLRNPIVFSPKENSGSLDPLGGGQKRGIAEKNQAE